MDILGEAEQFTDGYWKQQPIPWKALAKVFKSTRDSSGKIHESLQSDQQQGIWEKRAITMEIKDASEEISEVLQQFVSPAIVNDDTCAWTPNKVFLSAWRLAYRY